MISSNKKTGPVQGLNEFVNGGDPALTERQAALEAVEKELAQKEAELSRSRDDPEVLQARWACLREVSPAASMLPTHDGAGVSPLFAPILLARHLQFCRHLTCPLPCMFQERNTLAQKWACLAADKQSRADKERLLLSGA